MHAVQNKQANEAIKNTGKSNANQSSVGYPSRTLVHAKLEMTSPGDKDEVEADAVANDVVGGKIARKVSGGASGSGIAVSSAMESQLSSMQGHGQQMPEGLRNMMEGGFGRDFSQVRLHTGSDAAQMSSSIHAKAFTHGNDIYFNSGQYAPNTTEGQHLIAHELTHVVQNNGKVAREENVAETSKIGEDFLTWSWRWGAFFTFLEMMYPKTVEKMGLEKERTIFGFHVNYDFEDDFGKEFLLKVTKNVIAEERRNIKGHYRVEKEYEIALDNVIRAFSVPPSSLDKVFSAIKKIAENERARYNNTYEYRNALKTGTLSGAAQKRNSEVDLLEGVEFDGSYFDNKDDVTTSVYKVAYKIDEKLANEIFSDGKAEEYGNAFQKQVRKFATLWLDKKYKEYYKGGVTTDVKTMIPTFEKVLVDLDKIEGENADQIMAVMLFKDLINSRYNSLFESHINTENLVPAKVWTNIFIKTLEIEFAIFLNPAIEGVVGGLAERFIANKIAAKIASDIVAGSAKDSMGMLLHYASLSPEEREKSNMARDFAGILVANTLTALSGPLLDKILPDTGMDVYTEKMDGLKEHDKNLDKGKLMNKNLLAQNAINTEQLKNLNKYISYQKWANRKEMAKLYFGQMAVQLPNQAVKKIVDDSISMTKDIISGEKNIEDMTFTVSDFVSNVGMDIIKQDVEIVDKVITYKEKAEEIAALFSD